MPAARGGAGETQGCIWQRQEQVVGRTQAAARADSMDSARPGLRQEPRCLPRGGPVGSSRCPVPAPYPAQRSSWVLCGCQSAAQDPRERPAGTATPRTHAIPCGRPGWDPRTRGQHPLEELGPPGRPGGTCEGEWSRTGDHVGGTVGRRTLRGWAGHLRVLVRGHSLGGAGAEPSRGPGSKEPLA